MQDPHPANAGTHGQRDRPTEVRLQRSTPVCTYVHAELWPASGINARDFEGKKMPLCLPWSPEKGLLCGQQVSPVFTHLWGSRAERRRFSASHTPSSSSFPTDTAEAFATCSQTFRPMASVSEHYKAPLACSLTCRRPQPRWAQAPLPPGPNRQVAEDKPEEAPSFARPPADAFARPGSLGTAAAAAPRVRERP